MPTTLIAASAGTGKTYAICERIAARLVGGLDPACLVATTFTRKAAAELAERIRARIQQAKDLEPARRDAILDRLELAAIGTVHSVAHRFLRRHALRLGLSPRLEILDEGEDSGVGSRHLSRLLQENRPACWDEFSTICGRLSLNQPDHLALELLQVGRANAISAAQMRVDLRHSAERWTTVVGTVDPDYSGFDPVKTYAQAALKKLRAITDNTQTTTKAIERVNSLARHGASTWAELANLATLSAGKKSGADACLEDLRGHGRNTRSAPGLQADVRACAELAGAVVEHLEHTYTAYKRERGLADFVDLERIFLDLVRDQAMRDTLAAEIHCFVVDEFQDTNPIQLAIFRALQGVAQETVWVGDRKQAIFGFRGTDASLVEGVWRSVKAEQQQLVTSYRSAPAIVTFINEAFSPVFGKADVCVEAKRETVGVVECWPVTGNKEATMAALAGGIATLLTESPGLHRRDIAVLVRTNHRANQVAEALHGIGIPAVVPLAGLLTTREGAVLMAGMRVVVDRRDSLACAELRHLLETDPNADTPAWFHERLAEMADPATKQNPFAGVAIIEALAALETLGMSTPDLVLAVAAALDLPGYFATWGNPQARCANLDAIVELACGYEDDVRRSGRPATPSGLVSFLGDLRDAEADTRPIPEGSDAVQIMTYHKSKGLEWSVAICFDLDASVKSRLFNPTVTGGDSTANDPLAGRTLRYWLWPFGFNHVNHQPLDCGSGLHESAAHTEEGKASYSRQVEEDQRLLYVGCTRARDRLVLVLPGKGQEWLESLGSHVAGIIDPQRDNSMVRYRTCTPVAGLTLDDSSTAWIKEAEPVTIPTAYQARMSSPSGSTRSVTARIIESHPTGAPLLTILSKADAGTLGSAVHAFLAGVGARKGIERTICAALANETLSGWGVSGCLSATGLADSADAFCRWAEARWPGAVLLAEVPVEGARQDGGCWNGIIDALIVGADGRPLALIDHKISGGSVAQTDAALEHAPQLIAYREALGEPLELWVHQVLVGRMIQIGM